MAVLLGSCDGVDLSASQSSNASCMPEPPLAYCETDQTLFRQPIPQTGPEHADLFIAGSKVFNKEWQIASRGTAVDFDGLGPVFDNRSCADCHVHNGRGHPPASASEIPATMVVRLSLPGETARGGPVPHPTYGIQLNHAAVDGVPVEGRVSVTYETIEGKFADGETFSLRKPVYQITDLAYGPLGEETMISPRVAPPAYGVGLLEAVDDETLLALADPDDSDGDGISGRPNVVVSAATGESQLGRFGWKALAPSVREQVAGALSADMGITSSLLPEEICTDVENACVGAGAGGTPEITDAQLAALTTYLEVINVSARTSPAPSVTRGRQLFGEIGCAACHTPTLKTGTIAGRPELSNREISPFSDLLLHDMGEGLADGRPEFGADGREWRTAPLWYIGLTDTVSGHTYFLHDGRARSLMEAILWHGGEAERSRQAVIELPKDDRRDLIDFLESL